jgi:hypothetical protein
MYDEKIMQVASPFDWMNLNCFSTFFKQCKLLQKEDKISLIIVEPADHLLYNLIYGFDSEEMWY